MLFREEKIVLILYAWSLLAPGTLPGEVTQLTFASDTRLPNIVVAKEKKIN